MNISLHTHSARPRPWLRVGLAVAAAGLTAAVAVPVVAHADAPEDGDDSRKITVVVAGPNGETEEPSASASASPSATPSGETQPSSTPSVPGGAVPGPSQPGGGDGSVGTVRPGLSGSGVVGLPTGAETNLSDALAVGTPRAVVHYTPNPLDPSVRLSVTLRNMSDRPIAGTVRFSVTQLQGHEVGAPVSVAVPPVQPGQTVQAYAELPGLEQWTLLTGHVEFTPESEADGLPLPALAQDLPIVAVPWLGVAGAGAVVLLAVAPRLALRRQVVAA